MLISGFFFFFLLFSTILVKLQPFKKPILHRVVLILKSSLEQAQGPVSSSDAAVKTQTSCLLGLTSAPKQLWYQHQLTALVLSFLLFSSPGDLLLTRSAIHLKGSLLHYSLHF